MGNEENLDERSIYYLSDTCSMSLTLSSLTAFSHFTYGETEAGSSSALAHIVSEEVAKLGSEPRAL